jgi:hypothetical protein
MSKKRRVHRPPTARRRRRLRSLAVWALVAAVAGGAVFLVAYAATSGGAGKDRFTAQVAETPSDSAGGQPFQGGARLYPPVKSVNLGQVPLNTVVSHAFDLRNVGDAALRIEDVQVKMLEGC